MCWKDHYIDFILSYPSIPHSEPPQHGIGRYLPFDPHGNGCYLTYHSHFRLPGLDDVSSQTLGFTPPGCPGR
eukprot:8971212-Pyramimonas_sp.AAC.1